MKPKYFIPALLCALLCQHAPAQTQDMDKELGDLAEKLAAPIKDHGKKKVTVLDFTDLQGNSSELGRYIADQLTVDLVMGKRDFAILDRANLNKILVEHKLTASGLVDPENAKKLGMFAGVDTLILGTLIPISTNIQLTARIITTDTAEIVGAAKGAFRHTRDVDLLLTNTVPPNTPFSGSSSSLSKSLEVDKNSQQIGDLLLKVESLKPTSGGYGYNNPAALLATLVFANLNQSEPISIALTYAPSPSTVNNKRGDQFTTGNFADWLTGLGQAQNINGHFEGQFTEIAPGKSVKALIKYWGQNGAADGYPPYRLVIPVLGGKEQDGRFVNVKQQTFMVDVQDSK